MCHGEPPLPTEVAPLARARFAGRADVTVSHPHFIEFVAPGVSKGRAVRWLARRLGVDLGGVLAIGDQWNDIEMLAEVGHGTAMPTAPLEVQAVARYIAPPLAEEGVARMIESLVLAGPADVRAAAATMAEAATARRSTVGVRPGVSARIVPDDAAGRAEAIEVLQAGGIVALPTDTVYGVAVALSHAGRRRAPVPRETQAARTRGSCCSSTTPARPARSARWVRRRRPSRPPAGRAV